MAPEGSASDEQDRSRGMQSSVEESLHQKQIELQKQLDGLKVEAAALSLEEQRCRLPRFINGQTVFVWWANWFETTKEPRTRVAGNDRAEWYRDVVTSDPIWRPGGSHYAGFPEEPGWWYTTSHTSRTHAMPERYMHLRERNLDALGKVKWTDHGKSLLINCSLSFSQDFRMYV